MTTFIVIWIISVIFNLGLIKTIRGTDRESFFEDIRDEFPRWTQKVFTFIPIGSSVVMIILLLVLFLPD